VRRRERAAEVAAGELPPELAVGRCTEVWGEDNRDWYGAWRAWSAALDDWAVVHGPWRRAGGSPWSYEYLASQQSSDVGDERLARYGLTERDLPRLRRDAQARIEALSERERLQIANSSRNSRKMAGSS